MHVFYVYKQNFDGDDLVVSRPAWITVTTRDGSPLTVDMVSHWHSLTHTHTHARTHTRAWGNNGEFVVYFPNQKPYATHAKVFPCIISKAILPLICQIILYYMVYLTHIQIDILQLTKNMEDHILMDVQQISSHKMVIAVSSHKKWDNECLQFSTMSHL